MARSDPRSKAGLSFALGEGLSLGWPLGKGSVSQPCGGDCALPIVVKHLSGGRRQRAASQQNQLAARARGFGGCHPRPFVASRSRGSGGMGRLPSSALSAVLRPKRLRRSAHCRRSCSPRTSHPPLSLSHLLSLLAFPPFSRASAPLVRFLRSAHEWPTPGLSSAFGPSRG